MSKSLSNPVAASISTQPNGQTADYYEMRKRYQAMRRAGKSGDNLLAQAKQKFGPQAVADWR